MKKYEKPVAELIDFNITDRVMDDGGEIENPDISGVGGGTGGIPGWPV